MLVEREQERRPDAAGADESEDGRGPHVGLKPVDRLRGEFGQHLGHDRIPDHLRASGAACRKCFKRRFVYPFNNLRIEFAQHADGVDADREHSGERPWAHSAAQAGVRGMS